MIAKQLKRPVNTTEREMLNGTIIIYSRKMGFILLWIMWKHCCIELIFLKIVSKQQFKISEVD